MAFNYHQQNAMKIDGLLLFLQFIKIYDHLINIILNGDELRNRNGERMEFRRDTVWKLATLDNLLPRYKVMNGH